MVSAPASRFYPLNPKKFALSLLLPVTGGIGAYAAVTAWTTWPSTFREMTAVFVPGGVWIIVSFLVARGQIRRMARRGQTLRVAVLAQLTTDPQQADESMRVAAQMPEIREDLVDLQAKALVAQTETELDVTTAERLAEDAHTAAQIHAELLAEYQRQREAGFDDPELAAAVTAAQHNAQRALTEVNFATIAARENLGARREALSDAATSVYYRALGISQPRG